MNIFKRYIEYLRDNPKGYWFKRKIFGWGWAPATWQGWLVITIFVGFILMLSFSLKPDPTNKELIQFFAKLVGSIILSELDGMHYMRWI